MIVVINSELKLFLHEPNVSQFRYSNYVLNITLEEMSDDYRVAILFCLKTRSLTKV
jgi:hypothetical protein